MRGPSRDLPSTPGPDPPPQGPELDRGFCGRGQIQQAPHMRLADQPKLHLAELRQRRRLVARAEVLGALLQSLPVQGRQARRVERSEVRRDRSLRLTLARLRLRLAATPLRFPLL